MPDAVQHRILVLALAESIALHSTEGNAGVTEMSTASGLSQQVREKSSHSSRGAPNSWGGVQLPAPLPHRLRPLLCEGICMARAAVGFTAGSGLGKSPKQCRNPFFQVLRLKEAYN